jgi:hypothetical protein
MVIHNMVAHARGKKLRKLLFAWQHEVGERGKELEATLRFEVFDEGSL